MTASDKTDFYQVNDQTQQSILRSTPKSFSSDHISQKTLTQIIVQKSDKIIAFVLIALLLFFFMQSSGSNSSTSAATASPNREQSSKIKSDISVKEAGKKINKATKLHRMIDDDEEDQELDQDEVMDKNSKNKKTNKQIGHDQEVSEPAISNKKGQVKDKAKTNIDSEDQEIRTSKKIHKKQQNNEDSQQKQEEPEMNKKIKKPKLVEEDSQDDLKGKNINKKGKIANSQEIDQVQKQVNEDQEEQTIKKKTNSKINDKVKNKENYQKQQQQQQLQEQSQSPKSKKIKKNKKVQQQPLSQNQNIVKKKGYEQTDLFLSKIKQHRRRSNFFKTKQKVYQLQFLKLAKFNIIDPQQDEQEMQILFAEEQDRMEDRYHLSQYQQELSICAIIYQGDKKKPNSHQYVLNSVLNQKYQSLSVVYIADGLTEDDSITIQNYITQKDKNTQVSFVWNPQKKYYLESVINAIKDQCSKKKVTVLIDGDDQLLGRQTFKVLNAVYRNSSANLVYGNFIEYHYKEQQMKLGFSTEYEELQKLDNKYRSVGQKFGSLKTFRTRLAKFIKDADLKDQFGNYYRYAGDYALMYPLLQLACGQVHYMPEYNYLYFGYEVDPTYGSIQISTGKQIRDKQRYMCYKKYK